MTEKKITLLSEVPIEADVSVMISKKNFFLNGTTKIIIAHPEKNC